MYFIGMASSGCQFPSEGGLYLLSMSETFSAEPNGPVTVTPDPSVVTQLASRPYHKVIRGDEIEGFLAEAPELPGCVTAGATVQEALELLQDAIEGWIEAALAAGQCVPEPEAARLSA